MTNQLLHLASIAHAEQKLDEAESLYKKIIKKEHNNYEANFLLGTLYIQKKLYTKSIKYLNDALKLNNNDAHLLMNLGVAHKEINDLENAEIFLIKSLSINSNNSDGHNNLANIFQLKKEFHSAEKSFRQAIALNPKNYIYSINLASCLIADDRKDEAISLLINVPKDSSDYPLSQKNLFDIFLKNNNFNKAIKIGEKLIEILNASDLETFIPKLINCFINLGEIKKAKKFLNHLKIDSDSWIFCNANIDLENENFKSAITAYKKLLVNPKYRPYSHLNMGLAYFRDNDINKAEEQFKLAIEYKPNYLEASKLLGLSQLSQCNFDEGWDNYLSYIKNHIFFLKEFEKKERWNGISENKKILILFDQGLGDQIFFASLLTKLNLKNHYTCIVDQKLIKLFEESFSKSFSFKSMKTFNDLDNYDFFIRAAELAPMFIKHQDDLCNASAYLKTKNKPQVRPKTIGLSWHSNNHIIGRKKSLDLSSIIDKLKDKADLFINLQYGDHEHEIREVMKNFNVKFLNISNDHLNNIYELANLIQSCSEIYSISNTTAHLAGALGVKVNLLLPFNHHSNSWYWIKSKEFYSLWYPNVKIIEAKKQQNFKTVLDLV
jgi:tetratricopeptide (TPR) repeat protein